MNALILFTTVLSGLWPSTSSASDVWSAVLEATPVRTERGADPDATAKIITFAVRAVAALTHATPRMSVEAMMDSIALELGPRPKTTDVVLSLQSALTRILPDARVALDAATIAMLDAQKTKFDPRRVDSISINDLAPGSRRLVIFWSSLFDGGGRQVGNNLQIAREVHQHCVRLLDAGLPHGDVRLEWIDQIELNDALVPMFVYAGPNRPKRPITSAATGYVWIDLLEAKATAQR